MFMFYCPPVAKHVKSNDEAVCKKQSFYIIIVIGTLLIKCDHKSWLKYFSSFT